jgi:signal transduction histidine kinase
MKLRGRLAWIVLATTAPLVAGAAFAMNTVWDRFTINTLREVVLFRMENGGREECEKCPEAFVLPRPSAPADRANAQGRDGERGPEHGMDSPHELGHFAPGLLIPAAQRAEIYAYAATFESANPKAPPFPSELRAALEAGADSADAFTGDGRRRTLELALRMPWRVGPCAVVLARQDARRDVRASHDLVVGSALVGIGLVAAVLLAAGPAVARIRALAAAVRRSSEDQWRKPVAERGSDEIAELARAFNVAAAEVRTHVDALERREQTLREFVANTDHDLTTPLTVLLGHLANMRARLAAGGAVDAESIREAAREADYMASLVRNLGVAARLEAGEPEPARAPVDLNALVARVVARHRPIASSAGVALEFAVPEQVVLVDGDETLLEQAASNLVHNAVRHNRAGGHVAVTLEAPKIPPGTFALRVSDDGSGLTEAERTQLTARDVPSESARPRGAERQGLGLRIVRRIVAKHGMQFELRPREGGGLVAEIRGSRRGAGVGGPRDGA